MYSERGSKVYSDSVSQRMKLIITTVCVNQLGDDKANFKVVQHSWFVEVAERREVVFPHQDVRVS